MDSERTIVSELPAMLSPLHPLTYMNSCFSLCITVPYKLYFSTLSQQGGSGNEARANVARKAKEVEHILTNLKEEGVEIDDEIASIIDDDLTRIKAEAER